MKTFIGVLPSDFVDPEEVGFEHEADMDKSGSHPKKGRKVIVGHRRGCQRGNSTIWLSLSLPSLRGTETEHLGSSLSLGKALHVVFW